MKDKELKETYKLILEIIRELGNQYIEDLEEKKWYVYNDIIVSNHINSEVIYRKSTVIYKEKLKKVAKNLNIDIVFLNYELGISIYRTTIEKLIEKVNMKTNEPLVFLDMYNEELVNYLKSIPKKRKEFLQKKKEDMIKRTERNNEYVISKIISNIEYQYRNTNNDAFYTALKYIEVVNYYFEKLKIIFGEAIENYDFKELLPPENLVFDVNKVKEYFMDKGFDITYQDGLRVGIDINAYEDMRRVLKNDRRVYTK